MPVYEYSALNAKGKSVSGIIDAEGAQAARQKLRNSGMYPVNVNEVEASAIRKETKGLKSVQFFKRVRPTEVSMMTRQLSTLLEAGFPLVNAMDTLIPQIASQSFKKIMSKVKISIVEGSSFSEALSLYQNVFPPLYVNMVHAGESSGTLEIVLERLAEISEKQQALSSRIRAKLAYPVFMSIFGALVLFFLLTVIVPSITSIFADMNKVLPRPTRILISVSGFLQTYWWFLLLMALGLVIFYRFIKRTEKGRHWMSRLAISLPVSGELVKKLAVARFARTLGSLLENGVSMLTALGIVKNIVGNLIIAETIESAAESVGKGQGLAESLSNNSPFPYLSIQMIQVGEQSGALESMLSKVANIYENEAEAAVLSMTSLLEPAMILLMGVFIAFIVLSIMLPILEMNQLIA
ncbi:MAG: type II secretion system F family protein [Desulfobacterales bacterium]|jgi:general secretion pathway protein F|nr:type II secretion system F family protein [Desulfobacterales bacterium]